MSEIDRTVAEWELVAGTGDDYTWFRDVEFVNSTHGWLAGEGILLRSTDGGSSWHSQLETRWFFWCISIVSSSDLWAITNSKLYHSINGGDSWNNSIIGLDSMKKIVFLNSSFGFIGGNDGFVLTTDGGISWTLLTNPLDETDSTYPTDLQLTESELRISSYDGIYRSTDLGTSWELECNRSTTGLDLINETYGWAAHPTTVSDFDVRNWNEHAFFGPQTNTRSRKFNDIQFIDQNHGWLVGSGPSISYSRDGGRSWYEQDFEDAYLISVSVVNASYCWVAGADGVVARTNSGNGLGLKQLEGIRFSLGFTQSWQLFPTIPLFIAGLSSLVFVTVAFYLKRRYEH